MTIWLTTIEVAKNNFIMEKIVNRLINESLVNVDRYNNGGSTWLIFTETKQWVIELTKEGTLWYNYNYFKNLFNYLGVDVVENQHYITKWVEDTIQNGVKDTIEYDVASNPEVEDTIQNGVKVTNVSPTFTEYGDWLDGDERLDKIIQNGIKETNPTNFAAVEDAIQNGVKETKSGAPDNRDYFIEDAIQNGVKHTVCSSAPFVYGVKDTLQHGVTETFDDTHHRRREVVQTIRDGVKETYDDAYHHKSRVDGVIKNGIKQTCAQIPSVQPVVERILEEGILQTKPMDEWVNTNRIVDKVMTESIKETLWMNGDSTNWGLEDDDLLEGYDKIEDTINNGIKEVHPLPAQDGNRDWGKYYHGKEDRTKPFNEYLNDVIENGIKI
jgi:predicted peroxiredoxin